MKQKFILIFIGLLLFVKQSDAQQIGFKGLSFLGLGNTQEGGYFYDGGGFELFYQHPIAKGKIIGGVEYRMINWGNQVAINLGYNYPILSKGPWTFSGTVSVQVGWALFFQKTLAVWGLEYIPEIEWQSKKRFFAVLGFGLRFSNCPVYANYGAINWTFDLPVKLGVGFKIGKKKEPVLPVK